MVQPHRANRFIAAAIFLVASFGLVAVADGQPAQAKIEGSLTGNVGFTSKYVFRGGVEDDNGAIQGGIDYSHPSGFYLGYWGSSLDYTQPASSGSNGFENDLYAGYEGKLGDVFSYDVGVLQYLYTNVDENTFGEDADVPEAYLSISKGPFSLGANYALADASWTNSGDLYLTGSFSKDLVYGIGFSAKVGYYEYENEAGNFAGSNGTEGSNFRDAVISFTYPIGETGADMHLTFVQQGDDRNDRSLGANDDQQILVGATYNFDIKGGK